MRPALLLFLLPGCVFIGDDEYFWRTQGGTATDDTGSSGCSELWYADKDGDGYGDPDDVTQACDQPLATVDNDDDCDDTDASRNPETVWYSDTDGDGFGGSNTVTSCEQPTGGTSEGGDCDDSNADAYPGATETCATGFDDDCDGVTNQEDAEGCVPFFVDLDGDGYGITEQVCLCEPTSTTTAVPGDCDDTEAGVNPGAEEICDDGIDNDCDGGAGDCRLSGSGDAGSADALLMGGADSDSAGFSVATTDFDGDGTDDVVVGARNADPSGNFSGAVYVASGLATGDLDLESEAWFVGEGSGTSNRVGWSVAGVPDMNGDGFDEFIVGAPQDDTVGTDYGGAYLLMGPTSGRAAVKDAGVYLAGAVAGKRAGYSVAAGDWSDDGVSDVAVASHIDDTAGNYAGAVYLAEGPNPVTDLANAQVRITGPVSSRFGYATINAGDVNGDGVDDLAVGAHDASGAADESGAAFLFYGPLSGQLTSADADGARYGTAADAAAGYSLSRAGDIDGDGLEELLIGAPGLTDGGITDRGAAYLVSGPMSGTTNLAGAGTRFLGVSDYDDAGYAVAGGVDLDLDGHLDFLVGAEGADSGGSDAGAAYLVYGPVSGVVPLAGADLVVDGSRSDAAAGTALATGQGPSAPYIVVGASGEDGSVDESGAAMLFRGGGL